MKNMKKLMMTVFSTFVSLSLSLLLVTPAFAVKPVDTCQYVVDGNIPYAPGHNLAGQFLMPGYDIFGYNYQAHIFNGSFANAYLGRPGSGLPPYTGDDEAYLAAHPEAASHWTWPFRNVNLQMKWNDAWLANKDCEPNDVLDRHAGFDTYKGSGAWLTNHATGTYQSTTLFSWNVTNTYVVYHEFEGTNYNHDMVLTQDSSGNLTGGGGYPVGGPYVYPWTITLGSVSGNTIDFYADYTAGPALGTTLHMVGTINPDGSMSGTWSDNLNRPGPDRTGDWATVTGNATKVFDVICTVSDFVKIIAPPADAQLTGDTWYTADGEEIGKEIWGDFAIIQEQASDPCNEYGVINYLSPLKKGLGGW